MNVKSDVGQARRHSWLTDPGESLLLSASPLRDLSRGDEGGAALGLSPDDLVLSRLCTVPLPSPDLPPGPGNARWEGVPVEAMWLPLVWLPESIRDRRTRWYADEAQSRAEFDDEWAARVAVTLMASGLYDPVSGTWLDVLSLIGVDVENEFDRLRVQGWMQGDADPDLDGFGIGDLITDDVDRVAALIASEEEDLIVASMFRSASDLIGALDSVVDPDTGVLRDDTGWEDAAIAVHLSALAGIYAFSSLGQAEIAEWQGDVRSSAGADLDVLRSVASGMRLRLQEIREMSRAAFTAVVDVLTDLDVAGTPENAVDHAVARDLGTAPAVSASNTARAPKTVR